MYRVCYFQNCKLHWSDPMTYDEAVDKSEEIFRDKPIEWIDVVADDKVAEFMKDCKEIYSDFRSCHVT